MKTIIAIFVIAVGMSPSMDLFPSAFSKKIHKAIEKTWSISEYNVDKISVDSQTCVYRNQMDLFLISEKDSIIGYVYLTKAKGRFDYFDYVILFTNSFEIDLVIVLRYISEYGGEIAAKSWLKQFTGNLSEERVYGEDVQAISGATISANSITNGINEACRIMQQLNANNVIK